MHDHDERHVFEVREERLVPSVSSHERIAGVTIVKRDEATRRTVATVRESIHVDARSLETERLDDALTIEPQRIVVTLGVERADVRKRTYVYEEAFVGVRSVERHVRFEGDVRRETFDVREART